MAVDFANYFAPDGFYLLFFAAFGKYILTASRTRRDKIIDFIGRFSVVLAFCISMACITLVPLSVIFSNDDLSAIDYFILFGGIIGYIPIFALGMFINLSITPRGLTGK